MRGTTGIEIAAAFRHILGPTIIVITIFHSILVGTSFSVPLVIKQVEASSVNCVFSIECQILIPDISVPLPVFFTGNNPLRSRTYRGGSGSPAAGLYVYEYRFDPAFAKGKRAFCVRSFTIPFGAVVSTLDLDGDKVIGDEVFVTKEGGSAWKSLIAADQDTNGNITFTLDPSVCTNNSPKNSPGAYSVGIVSARPPLTTEAAIVDVTGTARIISIPAPQPSIECVTPEYEPLYWNDCDGICGNKYFPCGAVECDYCEDCGEMCGTAQCNNNCYNYATNRRTDTFAKPGCGAGALHTEINCASIVNAALADGLTAVAPNENCTGGRHKIALVVWPDKDYHWYRLDRNGTWSHKPGKHEATNVDNSDQPILNPETADRGNYTDFCGYFCACSDVSQGQGRQRVK